MDGDNQAVPYYYAGERGNKPYELELMLRINVLQNFYDLLDMGVIVEVIQPRLLGVLWRGIQQSSA